MSARQTLDEMMSDFDKERAPTLSRELAEHNSPAATAAREARRREEFERGVRLGWHDTEGNPLPQPGEEEEDSP